MNKKAFGIIIGTVIAGCTVTALVTGGGSKNLVTSYGAENDVWNHYLAVTPTCEKHGIKEYWVNCRTHEHQFSAPLTYDSIVDKGAPSDKDISSLPLNDDRLLILYHDFASNGECKNCNGMAVPYNSTTMSHPEYLSVTTSYTAPVGFKTVYEYDGKCGGDASGDVFFHSGTSVLSNVVSFKFAILTDRTHNYRVISGLNGGTSNQRIPYQSDGHAEDWVTMEFTRASASSSLWHLKTSQPEGNSAGPALDLDLDVQYNNDIWGVSRLVNNGDDPYGKIYITDIVTKKADYHMHDFEHVDQVDSTCLTPGIYEHDHCKTCNQNISPLGEYMDNVEIPMDTHDFGTGSICSKCQSAVDMFNSTNVDANKYTVDTETPAPTGFSKVYSIADSNLARGLLKTDGVISSYSKVEFMIKGGDNKLGLQPTVDYEWLTFYAKDWVKITAVNNGSGSWTVTNSLGLFNSNTHGNVSSYTKTLTNQNLQALFGVRSDAAGVPYKMTEIVAYVGTPNHVHTIEDDSCTVCGYKVISMDGADSKLWNPANITRAHDIPAAGFATAYKYGAATGGGTSDCFFKTGNALGDVTEVKFAVKDSTKSATLRLYVQPSSETDRRQTSLKGNGWIIIDAVKQADGSWVITLTGGTFSGYGWTYVGDGTTLTVTSASHFWDVGQILADGEFEVSELLVKTA